MKKVAPCRGGVLVSKGKRGMLKNEGRYASPKLMRGEGTFRIEKKLLNGGANKVDHHCHAGEGGEDQEATERRAILLKKLSLLGRGVKRRNRRNRETREL